jgi:hypothetical protein
MAGLVLVGSGRLGDRPTAEPAGPDDARPGREAGGRAVLQPCRSQQHERSCGRHPSGHASKPSPVRVGQRQNRFPARTPQNARGSVRWPADFNDDWCERIFGTRWAGHHDRCGYAAISRAVAARPSGSVRAGWIGVYQRDHRDGHPARGLQRGAAVGTPPRRARYRDRVPPGVGGHLPQGDGLANQQLPRACGRSPRTAPRW